MDSKFFDILDSVNEEIKKNMTRNLIDADIIDSMTLMYIVVALQDGYSIYFDPEDITEENFSTVDNIWKLVQKYLKEKS